MLKVCKQEFKTNFLTNKENILSYVNVRLCSKLLNNFSVNQYTHHWIKPNKLGQNKESEIFLCQLGYNSIKAYILNVAAEGQHNWEPIWIIYKYMVNHKYTDQLASMKPLCRNDNVKKLHFCYISKGYIIL